MKNNKVKEHILWMTLLDAEARCQTAFRTDDDAAGWLWHKVGIRARTLLRDECGLNLDLIADESSEILNQFYDFEVKKQEEEDKLLSDFDKHLSKAQESLKSLGRK
jgi:hypothetical protein